MVLSVRGEVEEEMGSVAFSWVVAPHGNGWTPVVVPWLRWWGSHVFVGVFDV